MFVGLVKFTLQGQQNIDHISRLFFPTIRLYMLSYSSQIVIKIIIAAAKLKLKYYSTINNVRMILQSTANLRKSPYSSRIGENMDQ